LWAGRQLQIQQQWQPAVEHYTAISADSPFFADAVRQSYVCLREMMKKSPASLAEVRAYDETLKKLASAPDVTDQGRVELTLARAKLSFRYGLENSGELAKQIVKTLESADEDDRLLLSAELIVAVADADPPPNSTPAVEDILNDIAGNESALKQAVAGINDLLEQRQDSVSETVINTKLKIAQLALALDLDEVQRIAWMGDWADALQRLNRDAEAVDALTELAAKEPQSAAIQLQLCRALSKLEGDQAVARALNSWRRLALKLKPKSENWFEAKYNVALLLHKAGESGEALKLLEYLKAIPPGWSQSSWKADFDRLLIQCQN
jgi:tetratricopeptide (TPR) repeat protein